MRKAVVCTERLIAFREIESDFPHCAILWVRAVECRSRFNRLTFINETIECRALYQAVVMVIVTSAEQFPFLGMITEIEHVVHRPFAAYTRLGFITDAKTLYKIPSGRDFKNGISGALILGARS